jgi:hypothetical protein
MDGGWGYLIGSTVTIVGILLSQWALSRREDKRWKAERAAEELRWKREHDRHLEDVKREARERWAEDLRALYAAFLTVTREWLDLVKDDAYSGRPLTDYPHLEGRHHFDKRVRELLSQLELWAPSASVSFAVRRTPIEYEAITDTPATQVACPDVAPSCSRRRPVISKV